MDIKKQKGGQGSVNVQGDSISITINQPHPLSEKVSQAEISKINDILYKGRPKQWHSTLERVKNVFGVNQLEPAFLLDWANTFAIGRIRKEVDTKLPLLFTDTSWITHSISFWNDDPQMRRWLDALGEVATERAAKNLETYRVFFWDSAVIKDKNHIREMSRTIISHLSYGISVVLLDIQFGYKPIDVHVYTNRDGLFSNEFSVFNINELNDRDSLAEYLSYVPGFCTNLPKDGSALFFTPFNAVNMVATEIAKRCPNVITG
jgi:hypothetical protein